MGYNTGRHGGETYPERSNAIGPPGGVITPLVNLAYVDYGTQGTAQDGSIANPFASVQQALDAGYVSVYIAGYGGEVVFATGFVYLTGADRNVGLLALNAPQGAQLDNVFVATLNCDDNCTVITNAVVGNATFGTAGFLILNGPGALTFGSKADQLQIDNLTMGFGGTLLGTNVVLSSIGAFLADTIELYGSTSVAPTITCGDFLAQNCVITAGTITTTGLVELQDVKCEGAVSFDNAPAQPFRLDGLTNYWIKTNAVALTNPGQKVITDDIVP